MAWGFGDIGRNLNLGGGGGNWWNKSYDPVLDQLINYGTPTGVQRNSRPTRVQRRKAKEEGMYLMPQRQVTFNRENPQFMEEMQRYGDTLDMLAASQGLENVDIFKTLKDQYLQSNLGKNLYPNLPPSRGMQQELRDQGKVYKEDGVEMVRPGLSFLSGVPLKSVGELSDAGWSASAGTEGGVPLTNQQIRKRIGKELHSSIKGLMDRGLTHDEAKHAVSFGLSLGTPTTDPDKLFAKTAKGQFINTVSDPQFQARATIEGDILPPILSQIDKKKDLLNQLVQWEQAGTPGRTPLYGNSSILDMPYTGDSGMLAAEIAFDEANIEKDAIDEFLKRQGKKERIDDQILNAINSGGTPDAGYFEQQGYPFPQLASLVLATLSGGSIKKGESGGLFTDEQKQKFLQNIVGDASFKLGQ